MFKTLEAQTGLLENTGGKSIENWGKAILEVSMPEVYLEVNTTAQICLGGS